MYLKTCLLIVLCIGVIQAKGNVKILLKREERVKIISQDPRPTSTKNQLKLSLEDVKNEINPQYFQKFFNSDDTLEIQTQF